MTYIKYLILALACNRHITSLVFTHSITYSFDNFLVPNKFMVLFRVLNKSQGSITEPYKTWREKSGSQCFNYIDISGTRKHWINVSYLLQVR